MVKGLARLKAACTMTGWPSMLTQASSEEERLLPNDSRDFTVKHASVAREGS
jgi:hypothetical protein